MERRYAKMGTRASLHGPLLDAREKLRRTVEEYVQLDTELRKMEDTNFRVSIFGSARIKPKDPVYRDVFFLAQSLSERGIDVVTGGGPGLMEAANRGVLAAKRRRSHSYGLPLDLPHLVEKENRHLDYKSAHKRFSSRLDEFMRLTHGVVVAPGGIGTLLELMYVWQLLQLKQIEPRPMVLLGKEYWSGLLEWVKEQPLEEELVDVSDLEKVSLVDTPAEALEVLDAAHAEFIYERRQHAAAELHQPEDTWRLRVTDEPANDRAVRARVAEQTLEELRPAA